MRPLTERISRREDAFSPCAKASNDQQSDIEQVVLMHTEALVVRTLQLLVRNCPPDLLAEAAREDLLALEPHLLSALEVLEDIERRRSLTDEERNQRHSFKMLLACSR